MAQHDRFFEATANRESQRLAAVWSLALTLCIHGASLSLDVQWLIPSVCGGHGQLVAGIGRTFPFEGRQPVLDQLWVYHEARFTARTFQDRRQHPIPTFMGQSGIGKYVNLVRFPRIMSLK